MSFSILSIAFLLFFIIISAVEIYRYINRGFVGSMLAFGSSIISLILTIVFSPKISGSICELLFELVIKRIGAYNSIVNQFPSIETVVIAALTAILNTLLFVIIFFIIRKIARIVISIICRSAMRKNNSDPGYAREKEPLYKKYERLFSGVIGAVCGFMLCIILTAPVIGTTNFVLSISKAVDAASPGILDRYMLNGERISTLSDELHRVTDDVVGGTFYEFGGKHLYEASACADIGFDRVYLSNELDNVTNVLSDISELSKSIKVNHTIGADNIDTLNSLSAHIEDFELLHYVAADILSTCSNAWLDGNTYMGIAKPQLHSVVDGAVNDVLEICSLTDEKSIKLNLNTLIRLYALIIDSGIMDADMSNINDMIAFVDESDLIDKVNAELSANPYMNGISVSSIAMSALADTISIESIGAENYNVLMTNIADAINTVNGRGYGSAEEKVEVMTTYAQKYIAEYNLDVPDSVAQVVAQELLNAMEMAESGEITADDVSDLISKYKNN